MNEGTQDSGVIVVRASGNLDRSATHRLVNDVQSRITERTELIVLSLESSSVHWNALCVLGLAANAWRAAMHDVVIRATRPSLRATLANVDGMR